MYHGKRLRAIPFNFFMPPGNTQRNTQRVSSTPDFYSVALRDINWHDTYKWSVSRHQFEIVCGFCSVRIRSSVVFFFFQQAGGGDVCTGSDDLVSPFLR